MNKEVYWNFPLHIKGVDADCVYVNYSNAEPERDFSLNNEILDCREAISEKMIEAGRLKSRTVVYLTFVG